LVPLLTDMTQTDSARRPTMDESILWFNEIRAQLGWWKMSRSRVANVDENVIATVFRSVIHWVRQIVYTIQGLPAVPDVH
ncbi:hypothetical protein C8J56DRAFT_798015, partial [Mycena floridula]